MLGWYAHPRARASDHLLQVRARMQARTHVLGVPLSPCRSVAYLLSRAFVGTWAQVDAVRQGTPFLGKNGRQTEEAS